MVFDRFGQPLVMLRDRLRRHRRAGHRQRQGLDRGELHAATQPTSSRRIKDGTLSSGLASLPHVTPLAGGVVIEAGGSLLGGVGVAGAPGGDKDEACAKAGLDAVRDKLDF